MHKLTDTVHKLCHYQGKLKTSFSVQPISQNTYSAEQSTRHYCLSNTELLCETSSKLPQQHTRQKQLWQSTTLKDALHLPCTLMLCSFTGFSDRTGSFFFFKKKINRIFARYCNKELPPLYFPPFPHLFYVYFKNYLATLNSSMGKFWLPLKWTIRHFAPAGIGSILRVAEPLSITQKGRTPMPSCSQENTQSLVAIYLGFPKGTRDDPQSCVRVCICSGLPIKR